MILFDQDVSYLEVITCSIKALAYRIPLAPKFYGPYKIIHDIGEVAYELYFSSSDIHKDFRVSWLKKVLGHTMLVQTKLQELV